MDKKHRFGLHVEKNAYVVGENGVISFPNGQVITDGTKQRNGTIYDIPSMDLSEYKGQVTAQHEDGLLTYVGEALGLAKTENAVTISGIRFAVKNALGRVAYDLMAEGFPLDLSIETYGPWPDESDDTYYKAKLIGLSVVVVGNNKSATMGKEKMALIRNSLAQAKEDGLDTSEAEKLLEQEPEPEAPKEPEPTPKKEDNKLPKKDEVMFVTKKNSRSFAIKVTYKNAAGDEVVTELAPSATIDVSEDQAEAVEKQLTEAQEPQPDMSEIVKEAVNAAVAPLNEKLGQLEKTVNDKSATAPKFQEGDGTDTPPAVPGRTANRFGDMDWKERVGLQLQSRLSKSFTAMQTLQALNEYHLEQLKEKKIVKNTMTLDSFSDFVLPPEMITEIQGKQSNYQPLLNAFPFQETLRLKMMWLERDGEIEMEDVAMMDEGTDSDLKPLSEYATESRDRELKEFAAVTPVDASAIRFSAIDVVDDLAAQYRKAYDKKLSQSIIGRLEQAVEFNGNTVPFSLAGGEVSGLVSLVRAWAEIAEFTPDGTFVLNMASVARIMEAQLRAGINGPLSTVFRTGPDGRSLFLDRPYVIVPSSLLPTIDTNQTKTWGFEGDTVTVNSGIFYADPSVWKGRVSGGLNYSMSDQAAYEEAGQVKSSFQRDKVLFRGYGYRASAILDRSQVAAIGAAGVS